MTFAVALAGIQSARKILTLAAVMVLAAAVYVWGEAGHRDARSLASWADLACASAKSEFRVDGQPKREWGTSCLSEVKRLAQIEDDLKDQSLDALLANLERREGKSATDAALAAAMSKRAADAAERMERADATVEDDRVGNSWACAVNELGGMRASGC